ncbi:hypothetical protein M514_04959 [Trichuris suis]|uniref:Uncharacterized protein n=1 Tax=Trichuris suis TaxID=68888 RepID=A0A085MAD6_9BILA|nr:hypothetical protein M513_04959 [Trichuris suis]KFD71195.1 hypothetical protein M514_04959 [Trichuris suis]KHJ48241.1 hypothetical protein D918_01509 [Trichuris suis]
MRRSSVHQIIFHLIFTVLTIDSRLFPKEYSDTLNRGINAIPGGIQPIGKEIYLPKNPCQALAYVADMQIRWAKTAKIKPASLRNEYLRTLRIIRRDAKRAGRHDEFQQCMYLLQLYLSPTRRRHYRLPSESSALRKFQDTRD